jgi:predicted DsbA family dithiol-disulfide isomerase
MKVEIWSDIVCPFCYIGKRRFERALEQSDYSGKTKVIWKSFLLNPYLKTDPELSLNEYLAKSKGWTLDEAKKMNTRVTHMATQEGLEYHLDRAVVANSFDAHRMLQLAKSREMADAVGEALFHAYFTEGENIADHTVLKKLGIKAGLDEREIQQALHSDAYANKVWRDVEEARRFGIQGVPFFVIDRQYGISGAQSVETFSDVLNKAQRDHLQKQATN